MNTEEIKALHQQYVMPTYAPGLAFVQGRGTTLWDADGKSYLDFASGIAVTNLGHCHPAIVKAIKKQAKTLMHVSNLYFNEVQPQLAKKISEKSLGGKVFFCNSGAEANEGLIKLARLWGSAQGKYEIITLKNSFHGRTLATLTATGQDKVKTGFGPLPDGFAYAELNDIESVKAQLSFKTVAVMVESVQAEGGVILADPEFLKALRALCDEKGLLLLMDEVQAGVGRTGAWFGYEHAGIKPDAMSLAKGLGGGFPIGAFVATPALSDVLKPGTHGTTFGGTPLACSVALAVLETLERDKLVEHAAAMGAVLSKLLAGLVEKYDFIKAERGQGLLRGLVAGDAAMPIQQLAAEKGLIVIATAGTVVRLLPPLTVTKSEIKKAVAILDEACQAHQLSKKEAGA